MNLELLKSKLKSLTIPKNTKKITKGMIFAGCSFTWGQGLYYYSNLPTLKEPRPNYYDPEIVTNMHVEYMKTFRYPRLVANHFKSVELVAPFNGGSIEGIVDWWEKSFSISDTGESAMWNDKIPPNYDYNEVSHIVFQLTQWPRNYHKIQVNEKEYIVANLQLYSVHPGHTGNQLIEDLRTSTIFKQWLKENNISFAEWEYNSIQLCLKQVRDLLIKFEQKGMCVTLFSWPADMAEYALQDDWLCKRFMKFEYKNSIYNDMENMMNDNPELIICNDYDNFIKPPQDLHPSLKCHQVMAENVIRHLERKI